MDACAMGQTQQTGWDWESGSGALVRQVLPVTASKHSGELPGGQRLLSAALLADGACPTALGDLQAWDPDTLVSLSTLVFNQTR